MKVNEILKNINGRGLGAMSESKENPSIIDDRFAKAINIFNIIIRDTPDIDIETAIKAAAKMALIRYGGEFFKLEKACKEIVASLKKKKHETTRS